MEGDSAYRAIYGCNSDDRAKMLSRLSINDLLARTLTVILGLNLNGLFYLWLGLSQIFSGVILFLSVALILNLAKRRVQISAEFLLFAIAVLLYLFVGCFFYSHLRSVNAPEDYLRTYLSSLVVIYSLVLYLSSLLSIARLVQFLCFVRNVLFAAAVSVVSSPFLYGLYVNPPPSSAYRMAGFFANPNEAAMASLLAVCLIVGYPFASRAMQVVSLSVSAIAVILTFSKTGILLLILLGAVYLYVRGSAPVRVVFSFSLVLIGVFFLEPSVLQDAVIYNSFYELDQSQEARLRAVFSILSGDVGDDVSTGRSYLWKVAFERILEVSPGALGLGSMHHMIGGIEEFGIWQGVHNTFLMVFGEAGLLPALLLIISLLFLIAKIYRLRVCWYPFLGIAAVLLFDMFVTHGALGVRYHNLGLALMFGLAMNKAAQQIVKRGS